MNKKNILKMCATTGELILYYIFESWGEKKGIILKKYAGFQTLKLPYRIMIAFTHTLTVRFTS